MAHVIHAFRPEARLPEAEAGIAGQYRSVLHGRSALLLMDNAASREQVEPLIPPGGCVLMVTSRRTFALPGLVAKRLDVLPSADAEALLRRMVPRMAEEAAEIARLCGYLPIALRLAGDTLAERHDLAPSDYSRRLNQGRGRLELVEASLTLSYELLNAERQRLWSALSVFPDSFDRAAASAVWHLTPDQSENLLSNLVRSSLVEWLEGRYRLHDLARVFAAHCLGEACHDFQRRHAEHFLNVLKEADTTYLRGGEEIRRGLSLFDTERINIQAGQAWSKAHARVDHTAARMCSDYALAGRHCLWIRLSAPNLISWQEAALAAARRLNDRPAQGSHLVYWGGAYIMSGKPRRGGDFCTQALAIARESGDRCAEGLCLSTLGLVYQALGEPRRAVQLLVESLDIAQEIGDWRSEAKHFGNLGEVYLTLGESRRAIDLFEKGILVSGELGDQRSECAMLRSMGWAYLVSGEPRRAIELCGQAVITAQEIGYEYLAGLCFDTLAWAHSDLGESRRAVALSNRALVIAREISRRSLEGLSFCSLGRAYWHLGEPLRAIETLEKSLAIAREVRDRRMEALSSWCLGLVYEETGELNRAAALMEVRVDFEKAIGHTETDAHAARVDGIKARIADSGP